MKHTSSSLFLASAVLAATAFAQGPHQPAGTPIQQHLNSGLNMALQTTVNGTVSSVQLAYGAQYPSIVVDKSQIKIAPVWFMLDNNFELAAGDQVSVLAAPSYVSGDTYLYAIRITKTASGASIVLRSNLGVPLWTGMGSDRGTGPTAPCTGSSCIDAASIQTASGTIDRVSAGLGIQMPTLVLKLADGTLLTVKIGSERLLLAADFELNPGAALTVKYAHETCNDENVALELTDAAGRTIKLRNTDGTPVRP